MNVRITGFALVFLAALKIAAAQDQGGPANPAEPDPVLSPDLIARYEEMAKELQQGLSKREITIKTVPAQQTKLFRADPKLLENKFVAQFALVRQSSTPLGGFTTNSASIRRALETRELLNKPVRTQFKFLLDQFPVESRPGQPMIDFLTSEDCDRDVRLTATVRGLIQFDLNFQVFAPSAELAEQRARAIVELYDGGFLRPVQRLALEEGKPALEDARSRYQALPQISAEIAAVSAKLAKPSEISGDILSQLKAQKVMQTVEMAGLSARVKACDAMLGDPKRLEISTLQSINDMKVKAEIERVGIKEKLDQINAFIVEGNERKAMMDRRADLLSHLRNLRQVIDEKQRMAAGQAELFAHFRPLDIPGNEINIGPVEWVSE